MPAPPCSSTPKPLFAKPPSAASTPSMLIVLTPLASPAATPPWVGSMRTTWFIVGSRPSVPPLSVTVPCVPDSGTNATDPVSCPLASRTLPFGLLNGL
jgi:hypothetical protein